MNTFKKYLQSKGMSISTTETYERELMSFINWCDDQKLEIEYVSYNELMSYVRKLQVAEISQRTIEKYLNAVKHYYNWCITRNIREDNPVRNIDIKGVKRRKLHHILKHKELEELYEKYSVTELTEENKHQSWIKKSALTSKRNKVILGLMIWQGIKTEELQKLTIKDIKLREGKVSVPGGRRSNARELELSSIQMIDLMEYTMQVREQFIEKEEDSLFGIDLKGVMTQIKKKLKSINPNITGTKQIRASVITNWLKLDNLRQVQYKAGHRYVSSTEAYLINDLDDLTEDVMKFHPFG